MAPGPRERSELPPSDPLRMRPRLRQGWLAPGSDASSPVTHSRQWKPWRCGLARPPPPRRGPLAGHRRQCGQSTRSSPAKGSARCGRAGFPGWTTGRRTDRRLPRQADYPHRALAEFDRPGSTHSAVSNPAQNILYRARARFRVNQFEGALAAQRAVWPAEPTGGRLVVAYVVLGQRNNPRQPVEAVGLEARQASPLAPPLQAAWREIQTAGQFLQGQAAGVHNLRHNLRAKAFPDRGFEVALGVQGAAKSLLPPQFRNHGTQFVYHYVVYYSAIWRKPVMMAALN